MGALILFWIYALTLASASASLAPIVVFDPAIKAHQKYANHLPRDQHSSDSHNRIISERIFPTEIRRKTDSAKILDFPEGYEPGKILVRAKEQGNFQENKDFSEKLRPYKLNNPQPSVNMTPKIHLLENTHVIPKNPHKNIAATQQQFHYNHLELNPLGARVEKNRGNPQVHAHEIYENGYEVSPVVNPPVQRVNPVKRNRINTANANILDANSRKDINYDEMLTKKFRKSQRINRPEVRAEYEDNDRQINHHDRDYHEGVLLDPVRKRKTKGSSFLPQAQGQVRRQDEEHDHEAVAESTKKEDHQPEEHNKKHEEGGAEEEHEDHHEVEGDEEKKGYDSHHEHEKGENGHHDKEHHDKHYEEEEGKENKHSDDSSYYQHYDSGEKKEKADAFEEDGKFNKGHSTKGNHVVHKKDEYEKVEEFYDESHDEDDHEKEGGYHHKFEKENGGSEKSGHYDAGEEYEEHGKKSEHEKGHHYKDKKGHNHQEGDEKHHEEASKYGKKGGHEDGKKWEYKESH
ncbi:DEAD-box ATP-dependent RNA helicase 42 [Fopius arisanus]|uniref:DEAD-box ATP-dependent RNA helicase 42 n=1 Tax=Fopius arisanus TaxID=64838 RepID=A0A0C9QTI1_9HYME|nr:PREDICTED: DEAD-box ATP-dependent RNA helicase 42-like [Fopius arisanus]